MKITITIESDDLKEAARTLQGLSNRLDTVTASDEKKPAKTIVEPRKPEPYPPLVTQDEPEEAAAEETPEKPAEEPSQKREKDPNAPWSKKFPDGCRHCGTKEKNHMGKGLCTTCYFPHRSEYA